jgi:ribose transport system permease protein
MSQSTPVAPDIAGERRLSRWLSSGYAAELSLFLVLVVMVIFFTLASPFFLTWTNLVNLGQTVAASGIVAIAMTLVIVSGGIDLSVGSVAALAGVLTSLLWTFMGVPLALAALLGVLSGLVVGAVNGFMITRIKINPLIATLATFSIVRGLAFVISNGQTNQLNNDAFKFLGRGAIAGVPFSLLILIAVYAVFSFVFSQTRFGRNIFAIGGNAEASRLAGIRINRTLLWVYLISGVVAGCAGILIASQLALSAPRAAVGLELTAIAAVVLGGTSLSGGKGTLLGTILGVLILRILDNGLVLLNVSSFYQEVASGAVLLLAVGFDQLRTRLGDRS